MSWKKNNNYFQKKDSLKVILFSRYGTLGASSRIRSYQYLPILKKNNIDITAVPLFNNAYVTERHIGRKDVRSIAPAYLKRSLQTIRCYRFELVWIEKELLPWMPSWIESYLYYRQLPMVVDYDDAIFHKYDLNINFILRHVLGGKIDKIMKRARVVTVGNQYLAQRARSAGAKQVEVIPTVIDLERYPLSEDKRPKAPFTIGWIGSPTTDEYLKLVERALVAFCRKNKARLVVVGAGPLHLDHKIPVESLPWSEETEVETIKSFDVGIMPLPDSPWAKGKCGYKLIQYMACGRPVIASGVSAALGIVEDGVNGFIVNSNSQWIDRLETLYNNRSLTMEMGKKGRQKVTEQYCLQVTAPRLKTILRDAAGRNKMDILN